MTKHIKLCSILAIASLALWACDNTDDTPDSGPRDSGMADTGGDTDDGGPGDSGTTDGGGGGEACEEYCTLVTTNCTGDNAQYEDMADCLAYCADSDWPEGTEGATSGNSIACRIYHGGTPAMGAPGEHCPHAGPSGAGVCGMVDFRTDAAGTYTRVDRMGMPAVATALIPSARKNAYNDQNPATEGTMFAGDIIGQLTAIHTALDDDLTTADLEPCSMTNDASGVPVVPGVTLPECVGQTVAPGGPTVASLVLPDTLQLNPMSPSGFPNGRDLDDPVIDVTLAVILLDMGGDCGAAACSPATLAGLPLNPPENDIAEGVFLTEFPYLHPPHAP